MFTSIALLISGSLNLLPLFFLTFLPTFYSTSFLFGLGAINLQYPMMTRMTVINSTNTIIPYRTKTKNIYYYSLGTQKRIKRGNERAQMTVVQQVMATNFMKIERQTLVNTSKAKKMSSRMKMAYRMISKETPMPTMMRRLRIISFPMKIEGQQLFISFSFSKNKAYLGAMNYVPHMTATMNHMKISPKELSQRGKKDQLVTGSLLLLRQPSRRRIIKKPTVNGKSRKWQTSFTALLSRKWLLSLPLRSTLSYPFLPKVTTTITRTARAERRRILVMMRLLSRKKGLTSILSVNPLIRSLSSFVDSSDQKPETGENYLMGLIRFIGVEQKQRERQTIWQQAISSTPAILRGRLTTKIPRATKARILKINLKVQYCQKLLLQMRGLSSDSTTKEKLDDSLWMKEWLQETVMLQSLPSISSVQSAVIRRVPRAQVISGIEQVELHSKDTQ